ncbi:hypothetical protein [Rhizobium sp. SAFR-030]|uniref:hypothetical protein n=1 Tax=Rhizobium sp. SAFR-030 TaxID=3387277 RepID=UPI003F7FD6B8
MRRFALLIMVLAWLLQGMMPALAVPMPDAAHHNMTEAMPHSHQPATAQTHHHPERQAASHPPCPDCPPHTSKSVCAMSLCAACTALPPLLLVDGGAAPIFRYPAPGPVAALAAIRPAPLLPPPRA